MTAVEWLEQKIKANPFRIENDRLWNEAKEMEKEQHTLIWYNGWSDRHLSLLHENKQNNLNNKK
jgi:hypothetical protein